MARKQLFLRALLIIPALFGPTVQQLDCTTVTDGCDKGIAYDSILRSAIDRFNLSMVYGGTTEPVIFATSLSGSTLAQISYSCLDGSVPPAAYGSVIQSSLQSVLTCPNRCGSIPISGTCGLGVLIAEGADADCFSKARDVVPNGQIVTEKPSSGTFNTIGCWTDSVSARALTGGSSSDQAMTLEMCVGLAQGYQYAGLEYGVECHWGNAIASTSSPAQGQCNMQCGGDATELCGGGNLVNIYQDSNYAPPAIENPGVGTFTSLGCRFDSTDSRVLTNGSATDWTGMSVASCIERAAGYQYAGVEYYGECYWGNTLGAAATSTTGCDTKCTGNQSEFCGGSGRINIYEDTSYTSPTANPGIGSFELLGCYTDSSATRALDVGSTVDSTGMTVSKCIGLANESRYAAVENHDECYWGDVLVSDPATDGCSAACVGNAQELCGGVNRITLYQNDDWVDPNPTLDELIAIVDELITMVSDLADKLQVWADAVVAYHTAPTGSRKRKRDGRSAITTAFQAFQSSAQLVSRKMGSSANPGPKLQPMFNYFEMDDRATDVRATQAIEETRALLSQSDSMISLVDSSAATSPDTEMSVASEVGPIVGTAQEAAAVAEGGYSAITTGITIFGFSFSKLLAMVSLVLVEVVNHPIINTTPPASTAIASSTSSSLTSSSTAATSTWVVYPTAGKIQDQTDSITQLLYTMVVVKTDVYISDFGGDGINFWRAPLTDDQANEVRGNAYVASIELDCQPDCYDPTGPDDSSTVVTRRALVGTDQGGDEMLQVSQEQGSTPADYSDMYVYDATAGAGSTVYVVDTGANIANTEFTNGANAASRMKWITVDNGLGPQLNNDSSLSVYGTSIGGKAHGTCMLGRVVGDTYGIAKNANTFIVRVPWNPSPEHYLEAVAKSYDSINFRRDSNVVVSLSWTYPPDKVQLGWALRLRELLWDITDAGVFVVAGAGNGGQTTVRGFPAAFARADTPAAGQVQSMLVVGAVDSTGLRYPLGDTDVAALLPSVYAPGMNVHCANAYNGATRLTTGTSVATATVAGLAAYFYGVPEFAANVSTPALMKQFIESRAWTRLNTNPMTPVIWNNVTVSSLPNPIPNP